MINEVYSSTEMIAVIELYEQLQDDLIELICSSIARRGYISDSDEWRLAVLRDSGVVYRDAVSVIAQRTGKSKKLIKELFQHAGIETTTFDNGIYELAGLSPTPIQLSPDLTQILEAGMAKTNASLANLTGTTAVSLQQEYIRACNAAYMQVQSGGVSYTQAIANEIRHAAQYGTTVLYPSGHIDQLDVAVRRATLTGVTQTCGKVSMRNAELMGCDLMEITAHAGARPSHAKWQGKIVSLSGRKGYLSLDDIGYGTGDGFQGWNCRHNWFPFFEGIDTRAYTAAYLEKLKTDGLYELQEKQREYERKIREVKRELAGLDAAMKANPALAAQLQDQFARKSVILKRREAALEDFTKQHNLLRDRSREQAYYGKGTTQGFGRSTAQKAVWANRKALNNNATGGILSLITFDLKSVFLQGRNSDEIVNTIDQYSSLLGARSPEETKRMFEDLGYSVNPLGSRSSLKGIPFEDGGGFRISFFGDGYFQYHPEAKSHHKGAYWKIANGKRGEKRYELDGTPKE